MTHHTVPPGWEREGTPWWAPDAPPHITPPDTASFHRATPYRWAKVGHYEGQWGWTGGKYGAKFAFIARIGGDEMTKESAFAGAEAFLQAGFD